ncbi:UDP-2,4-diacetamido-2,4,6-trideoxy-beta-L-altropyranose hydrolase [Candidatus Accumulibacter contiguus]|uniref:UDP-2,4-diacetamido-2,4, 6-trideoxy-beta-L-altropyranose hydrolase n=2 Tax=Candidatus Accumulibacter TaxID=327159 RepID=A0A080MAN6_9PROT|nr:UDP-2,4-diacetamido-2,4,6-trideoxy-beta-L-altropyranose hydrolase [Candidatus Accumulibacter contiguus]KFB74174.1 MAG: UDP-2,4-diacetamido-2,4,6-trideoxy-beta-L-altropyranose hydrolase [Candidatus Accumulibacter phosphatis]NMQ05972.1 UDP-2,4-diacetamido-2,4,6-trideoxy-beta-L-altropyranose hydrolase [Candidatus Accumulibacter contiguus]
MTGQEISFRVDASLQIGTGHVMRCLTLADALRSAGAKCRFICREHPGHLLGLIRQRGHAAIALPGTAANASLASHGHQFQLAHAAWLGAEWATDAGQTQAVWHGLVTDWLIVDHYALDARWESALKAQYRKLMVIDDLADREHIADLLLDQNLVDGMENRYQGKVPGHCICLVGPQYALLRPEFSMLRPASLARRKTPALKRLLIFMGGSDPDNETGKVLDGVMLSRKPWEHIDVVVGESHSALQTLKDTLVNFPSATLHIQTPDMAKLMAAADLAVTAGGSVTWEKCILGLPSLVVILGENQRSVATMMHRQGAQRTLGVASELTPACYAKYLDEVVSAALPAMIDCASRVCDGSGVEKVLRILEDENCV